MKEQKRDPLYWVPKKYRERVARLEVESDLIDNCKYMLYLNWSDGWTLDDNYWNFPVKSKSEALKYIKEAIQIPEEERED